VGRKALHVVFRKGERVKFRHVWQRLMLTPGLAYTVSMKARLDSLKNPKGLVWRVYCQGKAQQPIGESKPLLGRAQWEKLTFDFKVPVEQCSVQILRLEAASKYLHHHTFQGSIWFDDFKITSHQTDAK